MQNILVIGAYRSGTNYLQQLVNDNLQIDDLRLSFLEKAIKNGDVNKKVTASYIHGWIYNKHAISEQQISNFDKDLILLLVYKNPYKWVDSLYRQSYDLCREYNIRYEKGHTPLEISYQHPEYEYRPNQELVKLRVTISLEKVCDIYNIFHTFWYNRIKDFRHDIVYHGHLYKNSEAYIDHISYKFDIPRRTKHKEPRAVSGSRPFDRSYYDDEMLVENLTQEQIDVISKRILPEVRAMYPTDNNTTNA